MYHCSNRYSNDGSSTGQCPSPLPSPLGLHNTPSTIPALS